jgi:hypothetical protein
VSTVAGYPAIFMKNMALTGLSKNSGFATFLFVNSSLAGITRESIENTPSQDLHGQN